MRCLAAASSALRNVLAGPERPAECLGVARGALYLRTTEAPHVLAVLCHDAVRLPCGLLLPVTSAELPLTSLVPPEPPPSAGFVVGGGAVSWTGPAGRVIVRAVREWAPARAASGEPVPDVVAAVRSGLGAADRSLDARLLADLAAVDRDHDAIVAVAARLLGSGPGLTPSGDDVLAGFLVGTDAFGVEAAALRQAIAVLAPARTTALSAALLWHAARGECIDELAAVAAVLTSQPSRRSGLRRADRAGGAVSRLLSVGHSSGAALALGLVTAAEAALQRQGRRAA